MFCFFIGTQQLQVLRLSSCFYCLNDSKLQTSPARGLLVSPQVLRDLYVELRLFSKGPARCRPLIQSNWSRWCVCVWPRPSKVNEGMLMVACVTSAGPYKRRPARCACKPAWSEPGAGRHAVLPPPARAPPPELQQLPQVKPPPAPPSSRRLFKARPAQTWTFSSRSSIWAFLRL